MSHWDQNGGPHSGYEELNAPNMYNQYNGNWAPQGQYGYNNGQSYYGGNQQGQQGQQGSFYDRTGSGNPSAQSSVDISSSNLQASASEFQPGSSQSSTNVNKGAVKKKGTFNRTQKSKTFNRNWEQKREQDNRDDRSDSRDSRQSDNRRENNRRDDTRQHDTRNPDNQREGENRRETESRSSRQGDNRRENNRRDDRLQFDTRKENYSDNLREAENRRESDNSRYSESRDSRHNDKRRVNSRKDIHSKPDLVQQASNLLSKMRGDSEQEIESSEGTNYKNHNRKYNYDDKYRSNYRNTQNGYYSANNRDESNFYKKRNNFYDRQNWRSNGKPEKEKKEMFNGNRGGRGDSAEKPDSKEEIKVESKPQQTNKKLDAASQRERLEHMIAHRTLECLVCCEKLRNTDKIWACKQCYHILHLSCVIRWAKASKLEEGWRCPACQNVCHEIPKEYRCYCSKYTEPRLEPGTLPHSCGEVCGRKGRHCEHTCTLLCHPGPCPDCTVIVTRPCGCGSTKPTMKCSSDLQITCSNTCKKTLNCGLHKCEATCHVGECESCKELVKQKCFCGKEDREVACSAEVHGVEFYDCGNVCGKQLSCKNHHCTRQCHEGPCESCTFDPELVKTCPCGKTTLETERKTCLDPIPCCDKVCNKKLSCGQPSNPHLCKEKCHSDQCPPCQLTTMVRCRCGHMDRELACKELTTKADDARCQKKCTKKRSCCKHKCNQLCCIEVDHDCPLPCNRLLSCGLHRCEQTCHRGHCMPCWRTSFEELYCECGTSVLYPPVACGTRPPACNQPCSRPRTCGHDPLHNCHTGACPPCTMFTDRWCHGSHEMRGTIPCYQEDFSCGLPCGKEMHCVRHNCIQTCHKGPCPSPCVQPCTITRINCEHPCNQPCHEPPCPLVPCKQNVVVTCQCGLRTGSRSCVELTNDYQKIAMSQMASKMADIQRGISVDITDIVNKQKKNGAHKTLECNEDCRLVERNRRLAIGLQIRNPDLSLKLTPRYSEFMRNWGKKDPRFVQHVHDKLTELVKLSKESKQKSRSHSFDCMNRDKRHFVHEYCEHFGCDSAAYDKEPNRNIVATAYKEKSWLPSVSVLELLQRESGQRKVPGPVLNKPGPNKMFQHKPSESVSLRLPGRTLTQPPVTPPAEYVDYFDNPP